MLKAHFNLVILVFALSLMAAPHASAQTTHVRKTTKTTVTKVSEGDEDTDDDEEDSSNHRAQATPQPKEIKESTMTSRFGSKGQSGMAGCKTEEAAKDLINDLKGDCKAWIKDQKADLGDRFLTSSCEEACDDCGTSLKRCSVNGTIRYLVR